MLSPEEQQMKICLMKTNIDEITNEIVTQNQVLVSDAEEKEQLNEAVNQAVQKLQQLNEENERVKSEHVRLSLKRMNQIRQREELQMRLEEAKANQELIIQQTRDEDAAMEATVQRYENHMRGIADRFRQTAVHAVYTNKEAIEAEIEKMSVMLSESKEREAESQRMLQFLREKYNSMKPSIPEDILDIVGKRDLEDQIRATNEEIEALASKKVNK